MSRPTLHVVAGVLADAAGHTGRIEADSRRIDVVLRIGVIVEHAIIGTDDPLLVLSHRVGIFIRHGDIVDRCFVVLSLISLNRTRPWRRWFARSNGG